MSSIFKKFFLPVICPSAVIAIIQQAMLVVLPLYILAIGGSLAESAAVIGLKGVGMMAADLPAGLLLARIGDKRLMICAAVFFAIAMILMAVFPLLPVLMLAAVIIGLAHGTWLVSRIAFIGATAETNERGRVMAMSAGTIRLGNVIGPALAGLLIATSGYDITLYLFSAGTLLVILFICLWVPNCTVSTKQSRHLSALKQTVRENKHTFMTAGVAAFALTLVRSSRALLLPLMGAALLLDEASIGLAISVGAVIDTLLFYPAGSLMDRIGRKPIFIASLMILGISLAVLPFSQGLWSLILIAGLMGVGNGVSAGVIMTVGSDLAPQHNKGSFIGVWRLVSDVGATAGPIFIGTVVKLSSLAVAAHSVGLLGVIGGVYVIKAVAETHRKE
ncbi:MAG: MFS transporter [Amphritea sp.]